VSLLQVMMRNMKTLLLLMMSLSPFCMTSKSKIKVSKGKGGSYSINLGDPSEPKAESDQSREEDTAPPSCDVVRGCTWQDQAGTVDQVIIEMEQKMFTRTEEAIEQLEDIYYNDMVREADEALVVLALARTVQAALGGDNKENNILCEETLAKAVRNLDQINSKDSRKVKPSIYRKVSSLASLQTKLVMSKKAGREKLFETIGEFLFLQGKLMLAREAFLVALRFEGDVDSRLNIVSSPSTIIKKVMSRAIEHEYLSSGACSADLAVDCTESSYPLLQQTKLNSIFWGDVTRSITHEKLEWWLVKANTLSFPHLEEGIYQAGVAAGVYLSRYQRPINAVPGLRAKPVWEVKETGLKKALDKIRENWKVIRDEGLELMKKRRTWRVDPGWVGLPDARGWWGEVAVKGVALHSAAEQSSLCKNALFTCRMIQQFPEASGCPKCKASFSLVDGHTHIPAHAGPTNARLRAHMGLVVPKKGDVHMRIANQTVGWKTGKWTIIDDSFEHEIVNDSDGQRLILLVDFRHPDISRENKEEFNWSREDMKNSGLSRSESIIGGFPS